MLKVVVVDLINVGFTEVVPYAQSSLKFVLYIMGANVNFARLHAACYVLKLL